MPLPPAARAARLAAEARQGRRNLAGAVLATSFVVGFFFYCIQSVDQDEITEKELQDFRRQRELQQSVVQLVSSIEVRETIRAQ